VNPRVEIACGLDVHRSKIVGSIVHSDGGKETRTFTTGIDDAIALKNWILGNRCERVAMEATGIYWYPIYDLLEDHVDNQLKRFFQKMRSKIGYKPAIIALARKLLMLVHHLLIHREMYHEEDFPMKKIRLPETIAPETLNPHDILNLVSDAVSSLNEPDRDHFIRNLNRITG